MIEQVMSTATMLPNSRTPPTGINRARLKKFVADKKNFSKRPRNTSNWMFLKKNLCKLLAK